MRLCHNGILYNVDGSKRIAECHTEEKDTMVRVIVNLINKNN